MKKSYNMTKGSFLVVSLALHENLMIAEVTSENPLTIKVAEDPDYLDLREGEFTVLESETCELQASEKTQNDLLWRYRISGKPIICGLKSCGIVGGSFVALLPRNLLD